MLISTSNNACFHVIIKHWLETLILIVKVIATVALAREKTKGAINPITYYY